VTAAAPLAGSLDDWLAWQLTLHNTPMDLGLERVAAVARKLDLLPLRSRAVIVAGTNGKGSCVALIESLLGESGRVGSYTSPHLWRYNERVRIDGSCVDDHALCQAFAAIESARDGISLTYFEYGTLAALWLFARAEVDFAVLEVGLGGRLDAVNIVDADVALITHIGLDHIDWLGSDRECIGREKAGVMRAGQRVLCADRAPPASIAEHARSIGAPLATIGNEFDIQRHGDHWCWRYGGDRLTIDYHRAVVPENLAAALCVVRELQGLPTVADVMRACEAQTRLPGRREQVDGGIPIIYDVGHNVEAITVLIDDLARHPVSGRTHVVLGMLADKPVEAVGARLAGMADRLYLAGLDELGPRGLVAEALAARLESDAPRYSHPRMALDAACAASHHGDRIVVCGSFLTVAHARNKM